MSSSSSSQTTKNVEKKNPRVTQEDIDWLSRYETVRMPEEVFRNLRTKDVLPPEELAYQGSLPVPMGQLDDYLANICRDINKMEARFLRRRDRILSDYHAKGYAEYPEEEEEEEPSSNSSSPAAPPVGNRNPNNPNPNPAPGRRRFRPGVSKSKQGGKSNKMV